jgi:hypothetical protein
MCKCLCKNAMQQPNTSTAALAHVQSINVSLDLQAMGCCPSPPGSALPCVAQPLNLNPKP